MGKPYLLLRVASDARLTAGVKVVRTHLDERMVSVDLLCRHFEDLSDIQHVVGSMRY